MVCGTEDLASTARTAAATPAPQLAEAQTPARKSGTGTCGAFCGAFWRWRSRLPHRRPRCHPTTHMRHPRGRRPLTPGGLTSTPFEAARRASVPRGPRTERRARTIAPASMATTPFTTYSESVKMTEGAIGAVAAQSTACSSACPGARALGQGPMASRQPSRRHATRPPTPPGSARGRWGTHIPWPLEHPEDL